MANIFDPEKKKIEKSLAKEIMEHGNWIGRSEYSNGCWWECYGYKDKFYIGLCDFSDLWEASQDDIDDYAEVLY